MSRRALASAALLATLVPAPAGGEELGRLFYTPEQRAALDARRRARVPEKPLVAAAPESPVMRLDGFVRREGGRSTVWLDGVPTPEEAQPEGIRFAPARRDPLAVSVTVGEEARRFELKVGQKLDRGTGQVTDLLGDGSVRVGPARKPEMK